VTHYCNVTQSCKTGTRQRPNGNDPFKAEWSLHVPDALTLSNSCILYLWVLYDSHYKQRLFP
jgi:hypothetical protein